jgi:hypothetical protein
MDPGSVVVLLAIAVAIVFGPRIVLGSVGAAGDVVAQLFVPPDQALGWPRGVQESDDPWGWKAPRNALQRLDEPDDRGAPPDLLTPQLYEIEELPRTSSAEGLLVPVGAVRRN